MATRRITRHAIERYIERIDASASPAAAFYRMAEMVATGRVRLNPRAWTNCRPVAGTVFIYAASQPDACLVAAGDAVVTVVSRGLCKSVSLKKASRRSLKMGFSRRAALDLWQAAELEAGMA